MASIFRQKYTEKDSSGETICKQSRHWYIDYRAYGGIRKRIKGFKDKVATIQLAAKLEKEAELADSGIIDKYKEHRKRPLSEHLDDFKASLQNKGATEKHANLVFNRAKAVIDSCGFVYIGDVSASKVLRYLGERRKEGLSIRSSNFYLQAIKQLYRWLVADNRTDENPLAYLSGQNPKTDIRHPRRALTADELNSLFDTLIENPVFNFIGGKERAMLYMLAVSTGLRAGELATLTWQSLNLDDSGPSVKVLAAYSKHRRDDIVPLRLDIAQQLKAWKEEKKPDDKSKVFDGFKVTRAAKMLRKDLEAADIEYKDDAGRITDFHSLRHTFISNLTKGGASPKVAQALARHSTIGLTMDTYTHLGLYDERAALESLPQLPALYSLNKEEKAAARKTGTDDLPVETDKIAYKPAYKKTFPELKPLSSDGKKADNKNGDITNHKSLKEGALDNETADVSPSVIGAGGIRTPVTQKGETVFKTVALSRSATAPKYKMLFTLHKRRLYCKKIKSISAISSITGNLPSEDIQKSLNME